MFQPRAILLPIDLDTDGFEALSFAVAFAKQFDAALHFFFVNNPHAGYRHPSLSVEELKERIEAQPVAGSLADMRVQYSVTRGDLGDETHRYCRENEIDLLITSHERHSRLYTSLLDTRDEEIIESVDVPVLVMPKRLLELLES